MGTHSSKIRDILYVTSADLDPPGLHESHSYQPDKQPRVDYSTYGPKKYYKEDASEREIREHVAKIEKKEAILRQFKHYKDFDRLDYKTMDDQITVFESYLEQTIKMSIAFAVILGRVLALQGSTDYFTVGTWRKMFIPTLLMLVPVGIYRNLKAQEYHIANHEYFRMLPEEQAKYVAFDLDHNIYKDVNDMKHRFKYDSLREFYKTRRYVLDTFRDNQKSWVKESFLYDLGLKKEPLEEFAKLRQGRRKGNWDILPNQERGLIEKELASAAKLPE